MPGQTERRAIRAGDLATAGRDPRRNRPALDLIRIWLSPNATADLDGKLQIQANGKIVGAIGPGAIIGEGAALEAGYRTAAVQAITDIRVVETQSDLLDHDALTALAHGRPHDSEGSPDGREELPTADPMHANQAQLAESPGAALITHPAASPWSG